MVESMARGHVLVYQPKPDLRGHLDLYLDTVIPKNLPCILSLDQYMRMVRERSRLFYTRGSLAELLSGKIYYDDFMKAFREAKPEVLIVRIGPPYQDNKPIYIAMQLGSVTASARVFYGEDIEAPGVRIHIPFSYTPVYAKVETDNLPACRF